MTGRRVAIPVALTSIAAAAWWAVAPLDHSDIELPDAAPAPGVAATPVAIASLDLDAFHAPLWVAPPPPPPAPKPAPAPPPPPPFKLTLLGIVNEGDNRYAALFYDPDADRLVTAREGQALGTRTVESVAADKVQLRGKEGVIALSLKTPTPSASGGTP